MISVNFCCTVQQSGERLLAAPAPAACDEQTNDLNCDLVSFKTKTGPSIGLDRTLAG
jgi:hypothetical protein